MSVNEYNDEDHDVTFWLLFVYLAGVAMWFFAAIGFVVTVNWLVERMC